MSAYKFWQDALAGKNPPIVNEDPQPGFYRMKRNGGWAPVAVWPVINKNPGTSEITLGFKIGTEVVGEHDGVERWPWYAYHPITEAEYRKVAERGENWTDSDPIVSEMTANAVRTSINTLPGGMTMTSDPLQFTPVGQFREQIDKAVAAADAYERIENDGESARGAGLRNLLLKLRKDADDARKIEKAPHEKAAKAVDAAWMPLVKIAQEAADAIRNSIGRWEDDKRAAAKRAADRAAEEAARAEEAGRPAPPSPASNLPPSTAQVRPTYGKAAAVSVYLHVTKIDAEKVIAALRDRPEWYGLLSYLENVTQTLAKNGVILDGVTVEERSKVR